MTMRHADAPVADSLTSKIPPHSLEAERAVLGAILLERQNLPKAIGLLKPDDFYKEGHRKIFHATLSLFERNEPVDSLTVSEELRRRSEMDEIGGPAALAMLVEEAATAAHLLSYGRIVAEKALLRDLIRLGAGVIGRAFEDAWPPAEILAGMTRELEVLARRQTARALAFPARSIAELLQADIADPVFHVHGWIPAQALSFIVGDSETCKSWFALALALSVAAGRPFLDRFPVVQAPTLVISEENGLAEDKRRVGLLCRGLGLDPEVVSCYVASEASFSFDDPARYAALRAYVDEHGIRLVVIDSFVRTHRRKENDAGEMNALYLDRIKPLIRAGVGLVFLHHRRKVQAGPASAQTSDSDEIRGSGDIRAATHAVLFLRTASDTTVLVKHNKARGFKRQEPYVFRVSDTVEGGVVLTWEGKPEEALDKSGACKEAILLYAAEKGEFARKDLAAALKGRFSKKIFDPVLKALAEHESPMRRESRGRGHWYVYVGPDGASDGDDNVPF